MDKRLKLNIEWIKIYLLVQVIADLGTTFLVKNYSINLSIATFLRGAFLLFAFSSTLIDGDRRDRLALSALLLFIGLHTVISSSIHGYALSYKLMSIIKAYTFPFVIVYFNSIYKRLRSINQQNEASDQLLDAVQISSIAYSGIITIMHFIGVGIKSYPGISDLRIGSIGYFLAANEMGPFLLILSFLCLYQFYRKQNALGIISIVLSYLALLIVGTKTALIGAIFLFFFTLIVVLFKTSYFKVKPVSVILIVFCFGVSFFQLPSYLNIGLHKIQMSERRYYESLKKGDPVRESEKKRHEESVPDIENKYLERLILSADGDNFDISGYLYPMYEDIGHPNYVETKIDFISKSTIVQSYALDNIYNPNIEHEKEEVYNSAFSAFKATLEANSLLYDEPFDIQISMVIDGERTYKRRIPFDLSVSESASFSLIEIEGSYAFVHKIPTEEHEEDKPSSKISDLLALVLSGRSTRFNNFVKQHGSFTLQEILIGTGQLVDPIKGFEMDPIEIFIIYGGVGFISYFGLYFCLLFSSILMSFKRFKMKIFITLDPYILLIPLILASVIGTLSGHTFITPRVSIILALSTLIAWSFIKGDNDE